MQSQNSFRVCFEAWCVHTEWLIASDWNYFKPSLIQHSTNLVSLLVTPLKFASLQSNLITATFVCASWTQEILSWSEIPQTTTRWWRVFPIQPQIYPVSTPSFLLQARQHSFKRSKHQHYNFPSSVKIGKPDEHKNTHTSNLLIRNTHIIWHIVTGIYHLWKCINRDKVLKILDLKI